MNRFFRTLFLALCAVSLLTGSVVLANEAPPAAAPTLRTLGFCLVPTDDYKEFCHNKSSLKFLLYFLVMSHNIG